MKKRITMLITLAIIITVFTACGTDSGSNNSTLDNSASNNSTLQESQEGTSQKTKAQSLQSLFSQISTTTLDGEAISGDEIKGEKLTVLNVWGTWCSPCVEELPHLQELSEIYEEQGVKIVGIMQDGVKQDSETGLFIPDESTIETGKTLLSEAEVKYTIILPDETIMDEFINQMQYFPTTFFLDSEGNLIKTVFGANNTNGWRSIIDAVLEEIS